MQTLTDDYEDRIDTLQREIKKLKSKDDVKYEQLVEQNNFLRQ